MENIISLAQILKVKPDKAINFLVMPLGARVEKGDLLAEKKSFLGRRIEVRSPVKGILTSLSSDRGELVIKTADGETDGKKESLKAVKVAEGTEKETLRASRKVRAIGQRDKQKSTKETESQVLRKSSANSVLASFGFGTGTGELTIGPECLQFTHLNKDFEGKVIFATTIAGPASVFKASALGVVGIILGYIKNNLEDFAKEISGKVNLGFLILSEKKDEKLIEKIKGWKGEKVRVDGEKREVSLIKN